MRVQKPHSIAGKSQKTNTPGHVESFKKKAASFLGGLAAHIAVGAINQDNSSVGRSINATTKALGNAYGSVVKQYKKGFTMSKVLPLVNMNMTKQNGEDGDDREFYPRDSMDTRNHRAAEKRSGPSEKDPVGPREYATLQEERHRAAMKRSGPKQNDPVGPREYAILQEDKFAVDSWLGEGLSESSELEDAVFVDV